MSKSFANRDPDEEYCISFTWSEWNRIHSLVATGARHKDECDGGWPEDELKEDRHIRGELAKKIGDATPGNGIDDWPDELKQAYDQAVSEMLEDLKNG